MSLQKNYIFLKKINETTQERHNFACDNHIFLKTRENKNKQWTHLCALQDIWSDYSSSKALNMAI